MTVTLELNPGVEAAAKAEAQVRGVAVEHYLQTVLEQAVPQTTEQDLEAIRQQRMAILEKLRGKYAGIPGGSEGFAAQKEEEKAREERHWRDSIGQPIIPKFEHGDNKGVELKFYAVGRRRLLAAFADKRKKSLQSFPYPRRRLLGASPHSVAIYCHALY